MRLLCCFVALVMLWPLSARAWRSLSPGAQYAVSDHVLVGWVHSASIPGLKEFSPDSSFHDALAEGIGGRRILSITVTEVRKGPSVAQQSVDVGHCTGATSNAGDFVIAYHAASRIPP
jgi:hypothetical protein